MRPRDALELVALAALWGGAFLFMRVAVPEFGPLPMILLRVGVAALLLIALLAALVARLWFGERLAAGRWLGLAVGFSGVVILVHDRLVPAPGAAVSTLDVGLAILACLGGALCYGIAAGYARRRLAGVDPMAVATGSQGFAALALLVPAAPSSWRAPRWRPGS